MALTTITCPQFATRSFAASPPPVGRRRHCVNQLPQTAPRLLLEPFALQRHGPQIGLTRLHNRCISAPACHEGGVIRGGSSACCWPQSSSFLRSGPPTRSSMRSTSVTPIIAPPACGSGQRRRRWDRLHLPWQYSWCVTEPVSRSSSCCGPANAASRQHAHLLSTTPAERTSVRSRPAVSGLMR